MKDQMIYCLTNNVNGKQYVGKTNDWARRWNYHRTAKSVIGNAIRKYGIDNFTMEVLERTSKQLVDWREIYWIAIMDTIRPNGYNLTYGGDGGDSLSLTGNKHKLGKTESEETRKKKSVARMGDKNPMFGKKRPDVAERNRMNTGKQTGEDNPNTIANRDERRGQLTLWKT